MIVEMVGPSGAGKTSVARMLREELGARGAVVATDLVLDRPLVRHVKNPTAANLVQDVFGLPYLARTLPEHADLLRLSAQVLRAHAPTRFDLVMNARSVARRLGMFELARARAAAQRRVALVDEGPLLIAYHLFVYSTADPRSAAEERFAQAVPLPDLVVYVRSPLPLLVERAFSRDDRRRQLAHLTPEQARAAMTRALDVFDRLVETPRLRDRTVVLDNTSRGPAGLRDLVAGLAPTVASWPAAPAPAAV